MDEKTKPLNKSQEMEFLIKALESLHGAIALIGSQAGNYSKLLHDDLDEARGSIEALKSFCLK